MKVYIELTQEQKEKLFPLFDEVMAHSENDPVMLLAQIYEVEANAVAVCGIVDHEKSKKMQAIWGEHEVGKTNGYKEAKDRLMKARATT